MIQLNNLQWLNVIQGVSCQLATGRFYALVGPNGSGKSSLLNLMAGTRTPTSGELLLNHTPISKLSLTQLARQRAVMPQSVALNFPLPVGEVVKLGLIAQPVGTSDLVDTSLELVGMLAAKHKPYNRLSGGQQQRVQLARVLCQLGLQVKGKWLLLDEATASLDLQYQHQVFAIAQYLVSLGAGVVSVVHDINLAAKYADEVLVLHQGRLIEQGPASTVIDHHLAKMLYGLTATTMIDAQQSPVVSVARQKVY